MAEAEERYGGITGTNAGKITDCYAYIRSGNGLGDRVAGKNTGSICTSFSENASDITELFDANGRLVRKKVREAADAEVLGFDTKYIWNVPGEVTSLFFREKSWREAPSANDGRKIYTIKDYQSLAAFAAGVARKDERVLNGRFRLTADIDCGNRKLSPVGESAQNAFSGEFDGDGFTIRNFRIAQKNIGNAGFFGHLKGTVKNLSLEISVKGEGNVGGLCGVNEGRISCCGVVADLYGSGDRLSMGGIAGVNRGTIERSYAADRIRKALVPIFPIVLLSAGLAIAGVIGFTVIPGDASDQIYAPIEEDRHQIVADDDEDEPTESTGQRTISFRFNQTIHIDPSTGHAYLDFTNPSKSTNKIVVRLEDKSDGGMMAESGAILPGNSLNYLTLTNDGIDRINAGTREGTIVLQAYSMTDDSKAMVDSRLPVDLSIE